MVGRQVELVIRREGHPERRMVLATGAVVVGRADDNDIVLSEIGVSRRHARIAVDPEGVIVEDMGSGNGTFFHGKRLTRQPVSDGDEVVIDPFTLGFHVSGGEATGEITAGRDATVLVGGQPAPTGRLDVVSSHKMSQSSYDIQIGGAMTIGRSEKADIVLPEPAASRLHADVGETAGSWWVRDRGSSNGTWVNGVRVREKVLSAGDRLRIGAVEFAFLAPAAAALEEPSDRTEAFDSVMFTSTLIDPPPAATPPNLASQRTLLHEVPPPPPLPFAPRPAKAERVGPRPAPATLKPPPTQPTPSMGSVELDFDVSKVKAKKGPKGRPRSRPAGFFSRPINQISIGILFLAMMMAGGRMTWDLFSPLRSRGSGAAAPGAAAAVPGAPPAAAPVAGIAAPRVGPTSASPRVALDPVRAQEVSALMAEGMRLLTAGERFKAAEQFYKVQQVDPGNRDAERMGYTACEFIAMQRMYEGLQQRSASATERTAAREAALAGVTLAQGDAGRIPEARVLLDTADTLNPNDAELLAAREQLEGRAAAVARGVVVRAQEKMRAKLADMVAAGQREFDRSNMTKAVSRWGEVLDADPSRASPQYYQAEEGIRSAKDRMKTDSKKAYAAGLSAYKSGDLVSARKELSNTVRTDPYNDGAATRLADVRKRLKEQASDIYKEARVLEDINQKEKAIGLYQKVLTYVDDGGDPLAVKAQSRINALLQ